MKKVSEKVTNLQAFNAMIKFLELYYERTSSDDIGSILGDLQLLQDGTTADPAAWHDWNKCIKKTLNKKTKIFKQKK